MLVVAVRSQRPLPRRTLRRRRPREAEREPEAGSVPVTVLTTIRSASLGTAEEAGAWLARLRDSDAAVAAELEAALAVANLALHAHRTAVLDPALADVAAHRALAIRIGFGDGEALVEGRFQEAIELPPAPAARRADVLHPQERVAAVLGGRERVTPAEALLLRARGDLDAGRLREAALEARAGLEALLAEYQTAAGEHERPAGEPGGPAAGGELGDRVAAVGELGDRVAAVGARRDATAQAAAAALRGEPPPGLADELAATLRVCESLLLHRRLG